MTRSKLFHGLLLGAALLAGPSKLDAAPPVTIEDVVANLLPGTGRGAVVGPQREVVQGSILVHIEGNQTRAADAIYVVPADKRLVIEFLSVVKFEGPEGVFQVTTFADDDLRAVTHYIAPLTGARTAASQSVRLYSVAALQVEADFFVPHNGATLRFSFSGYLEDLP